MALDAGGSGDGAVGGVDVGAPWGSEAAGDLAEDDGGSEFPFAGVVGRRDIRVFEKDEELSSPGLDRSLQLAAGGVGGRHGDEGVVVPQRRRLEPVSSPSDADRPAQQLAQPRREDGITAVDGVLDVAQEMGETGLMGRRQILLAGVAIGDPHRRTVRPQNMAERMILLRRKAAPFLILFFAGLLFTSSVMIDTVLGVVSGYLATLIPQAADLSFHVNRLIVPLLAFATFTIIFKWLPDAHARWRDVAVGALVTTALFSAGRLFLTLYLERSGAVPIFGAVGSIVILLIWVYYSAQILLYGAEFTKLYADRYGRPIVPRRLAVFHEVAQTHPDSDRA